MGDAPDHRRLAAEVLGIRNAPPDLARRLVAQALVVEDRRAAWRRAGDRIAAEAPSRPGVYVLRDGEGRAIYVGKAVNLRRRLCAHFADGRWRGLKAGFARAEVAEWRPVGSELEALLREAELIAALCPPLNVQVGPPRLAGRAVSRALLRDVLVVVPSVDPDSVELVAARVADGGWLMQQTRRSGADLAVHTGRLVRFFRSPLRARVAGSRLAPIVFSWLAGRGAGATRFDPDECGSPAELGRRLRVVLADDRLFAERLVVR
jgi:hypothetical protein